MREENEALSSSVPKRTRRKKPLWDRLYTNEASCCISYLIFVVFASATCYVVLEPLEESSYNNQSISFEQYPYMLSRKEYITSVYSLGIIIALGVVLGYLLQLCRLPSLLGMLLTGIALRNLFGHLVSISVISEWGVALRRTAFIVILLRGGLSLDANAVRKLKGACLRLSVIPCTIEMISVALAAKIIFGMDIIFGVALGAVLGAVSPAVVIPALLEASKQGYGVQAGVPSLVIAAASLDDVFAITIFSLTLSLIFPTGDSAVLTVFGAPAEIFAGVFFGVVIGYMLHLVPKKEVQNLHLIRLSLLFSFSLAFLFGTARLGVDGAGAIGVLVGAFVASHAWKKEGDLPEEDHLATMWHHIFQPLLFGLIGLELNFEMITTRTVLLGGLTLAIGLVFRIIASFVAVYGSGLHIKERFFVAIAWMPKATVQAALAPVVLEAARSRPSSSTTYVEYGVLILTVAVMSILITAPFGALAIRLATPVLLQKDENSEQKGSRVESDVEMS